MERRPYFLFGDAAATLVSGATIATAAGLAIPESWGMVGGMLAGMAIGMVLAFPLSFLFVPLFGAMEVMIPVMVTGMLAGMAGGMHAGFPGAPVGRLLLLGAGIGLGSLLFTYALNAAVSGEDPRWTS